MPQVVLPWSPIASLVSGVRAYGTRLLRSSRRRPLTPKMGNKDFYKGTGSGSVGRHTKHGAFEVDPTKIRNFIIPSLESCELKPYVSPDVKARASKRGLQKLKASVFLRDNQDGENPPEEYQYDALMKLQRTNRKSPTLVKLLHELIRRHPRIGKKYEATITEFLGKSNDPKCFI